MWAGWVVGMKPMHQETTALIDNEPFVSTLARQLPALTRTPVSLTLQFPSEETPHWFSSVPIPRKIRLKGTSDFWARLGDGSMGVGTPTFSIPRLLSSVSPDQASCVSGTWIQSIQH
jgi:hypothetical protein